MAIFERGSLWYTSIIPLGGDNFTNDIAVGLRTAIPDAEKIKKKFGCVVAPPGEDQETIEVPSVGRAASRGSCRASSWPTSSSRGPRRSSGWSTPTSSGWATRSR